MPRPKVSPLPKNRLIQAALEARCARMRPHAPLPPETELAADHGASVMLVRQVLARLSASGILYRLHGKGTFVAPRPRNGTLLVVHHETDSQSHPHISALTFALAQSWLECEGGGPVLAMGAARFSSLGAGNWRHVLPHLKGAVFFRETEPARFAVESGFASEVPCVFLGSSGHRDRVSIPARYHEEKRVAEIAAAALKGRRVAVLGDLATPVNSLRCRTIESHTRACAFLDAGGADWPDWFVARLKGRREWNALACIHDAYAARAVQIACRHGLSVPKDLAVIGVNGDCAGEYIDPPLTSVLLDLRADAAALARHFAGGGKSKLDAKDSLRLKAGRSA